MNERSAMTLLLLLLGADFAFVLLHVVNKLTPALNSNAFNLDKDNGFPEVYQYLKLFWIIILFLYILYSNRCSSWIAWVLVFTYFLFDDALEIHERLGNDLADRFDFHPPLNLRLQDFGEMAVSAIAASLLLAILVWAYGHGSPAFRKMSKDMFVLIGALVFFGVFVDMAHSAIQIGRTVRGGLKILEDGGEMVVVSMILAYVFLTVVRSGDSEVFVHQRLRNALTRRST